MVLCYDIEMIQRKAQIKLIELASKYRVVTVIGPRQAGKSTLCRESFPDKPVINLEDPELRSFADSDPKGLLNRYPNGCFIDEIQRCPDLLSYVQTIVDASNQPGQFIISGSHQLLLMESISQSLAGRTAILKLLPLSFEEISGVGNLDLDTLMYQGSYPEIVSKGLNPTEALGFYVQTYLEKDVRNIQAIRDLSMFQNFLKLAASRSGSVINMASLSSDLGVSEGTIKNWISVAEASFVMFRLYPYYKHLGSRISKSPKLYFYDTGLLSYLLGIKNSEHLRSHPLRGGIFETYIVSESFKYLLNRVLEPNLYFYRDRVTEIDLIAETSTGPLPIEIKSSVTFKEDLIKNIVRSNKRLTGLRSDSMLLYAGEESFQFKTTNVVSRTRLELLGEAIVA
jgi:predicted AAA+ superfamily ATPase